MATWLAIVALLLLGGYCVWAALNSVRDSRTETPRLSYGQSIAAHRYGWAATATAFGVMSVVMVVGVAIILVTQLPALLALTGIARFTFPIAVAAFAAIFFGARRLFRPFLGKRWVRELIAVGSVVVGIGLVFVALALIA
jgi:hypothetical protein